MTSSHSGETRDMLGRKGLMAVGHARELLLERLRHTVEAETVPLDEALERITAADITAPEDLPAHPRSTMDGYAVVAADTFGASESMPCYLNVTGEVVMGEIPGHAVERGTCHRIATGGLLPEGADSVVMFEHSVPVDATLVEIVRGVGAGSNIIGRGDDIESGQVAVAAGRRLRPQDLGLLAGLGLTEVAVRKKVSFGIVSTGDEIVAYETAPPPGKIRNINTITLASQARRLGAEIRDYGIVADTADSFFPAIERAVAENDLVVFSGGSSVGARDLGEQAIDRLGRPGILVHGVALRPGKPILIGLHEQTPLFGLPGHPVSAMVCFDLFVGPALEKIAGLRTGSLPMSPYIEALLGRNVASAAGRKDIVRVRLDCDSAAGSVRALPVLGKSGAISTLSRAHGYIVVDEDLQGISENSHVKVYLYQ